MEKENKNKLRSKPTDELAILIERANLLPPFMSDEGEVLRTLSALNNDVNSPPLIEQPNSPGFIAEYGEDWISDSENIADHLLKNSIHEARCILEEALDDKPEGFRQYIWGDDVPKVSPLVELHDPGFNILSVQKATEEAVIRFQEFYNLQGRLTSLIEAIEITGLAKGELGKLQSLAIINKLLNRFFNKFPNSLKYEIDDDKKMHVTLDEFSHAINGVDITYIRKCKNKKCEKIYWAKRSESKCCSAICLNAYHSLQSINKRKKDPKAHDWEQDVKRRANIRAKKKSKHIGYTDELVEAYRKKHRKYPHRVIYDYLVKECLKPETKNPPEKISMPKEIIQPLRDFILERRAI